MKQKKSKLSLYCIFSLCILIFGLIVFQSLKKVNLNTKYSIGEVVDSLNGVYVYYNGGVDHVLERNVSEDGYNIGLKYQCVEFVKRYYYEHLNHKMPESYGHAKDFFDSDLSDGELNEKRKLIQYSNPSEKKPEENDLIVFKGTFFNRYGHVGIISKVTDTQVEIIQQNQGPFGKSREIYHLIRENNYWKIKNKRVLGWLRIRVIKGVSES